MTMLSDAAVITQRQLRLLTRVPEVLIFSTIQPVMFVLLFRFVFGGSINTGQPGGYVQLLMPGIFVQTVAFTLAGTASGLAEDMKKGGVIEVNLGPVLTSYLKDEQSYQQGLNILANRQITPQKRELVSNINAVSQDLQTILNDFANTSTSVWNSEPS